jgi:hypothetical protein
MLRTMEQIYLCSCCGEENELFIDPLKGEHQKLVQNCEMCSKMNIIIASFNDYSNEYDLEVTHEENE